MDISLGVHSVLVWERLVLSQLVCGICLANCKDGVWDITGGGWGGCGIVMKLLSQGRVIKKIAGSLWWWSPEEGCLCGSPHQG
jgi:hypothetical protein